MAKKLRDLVDLTPGQWVTSHSKVIPDLSQATIEDASSSGKAVRIEIRDGGAVYHKWVPVRDASERTRIADALRKAKGTVVDVAAERFVD